MAKILKTPPVIAMGNLYNGPNGTKEAVENANVLVANEQNRNDKQYAIAKRKKRETAIQNILAHKDEIGELLDRAGLSDRLYYPFERSQNKDGEMVSVPKSNKDMKKDVKKSISKLKDALQKGKITEEEYTKLIENLRDLVADVADEELVEEVEEELNNNDEMINEEEIEELYDEFTAQMEQNREDLVTMLNARNGNDFYEKQETMYDGADLDGRKDTLRGYNSEINKFLGIAGDIKFTTEKIDLAGSFNSKFKGYYISEHDLKDPSKGLNDMVGSMMEKSMIRAMMEKKVIKGADNSRSLTPMQQKALYYRLMGNSSQEIAAMMSKNNKTPQQQQSRQRKYAA